MSKDGTMETHLAFQLRSKTAMVALIALMSKRSGPMTAGGTAKTIHMILLSCSLIEKFLTLLRE